MQIQRREEAHDIKVLEELSALCKQPVCPLLSEEAGDDEETVCFELKSSEWCVKAGSSRAPGQAGPGQGLLVTFAGP